LRMGKYIATAVLAGGTALWAVNIRHDNLTSVLWQLIAITVLARAFIVGRRSISSFGGDRANGDFVTESERFRINKVLSSGVSEDRRLSIAAHDEQGRTPVERMFNSE
jgi:hypothetical protein